MTLGGRGDPQVGGLLAEASFLDLSSQLRPSSDRRLIAGENCVLADSLIKLPALRLSPPSLDRPIPELPDGLERESDDVTFEMRCITCGPVASPKEIGEDARIDEDRGGVKVGYSSLLASRRSRSNASRSLSDRASGAASSVTERTGPTACSLACSAPLRFCQNKS